MFASVPLPASFTETSEDKKESQPLVSSKALDGRNAGSKVISDSWEEAARLPNSYTNRTEKNHYLYLLDHQSYIHQT